MPRVAYDPDGQRPVGAATELTVDSPIGLQRHNALGRVEAPMATSVSFSSHPTNLPPHKGHGWFLALKWPRWSCTPVASRALKWAT